ncbi:MAG TPA: di-heme oxidoredictase family protein [Gemmatimonadaceae bacterium]|nr:di-heme oxidoredictase family protein [Gemmatimonadaceae bacterium]
MGDREQGTGNGKFGTKRIHPYTDLLLHDMGAALADNRPDFGASGRECRTAPLWGVGEPDILDADYGNERGIEPRWARE